MKQAKAVMDKYDVSPAVRQHNKQSLRFVNQREEDLLQNEDDTESTEFKTGQFKIINLGKLGIE